ncbi:PCP degradation transcriptional activation protein [compost metagenome]
MNLGRVDLNLLRVFDAIFEDRNLLLAGKRLHVTQSAVSHALGRLRDLLGDDLFVRTARGMEPTARAMSMAEPLRSALRQIEAALGIEPFVPDTARREFVVAANDYITWLLLAPLSERLAALAPHVNVSIRPSTRLDLAGQIDLGRIDIAVGIFADVPGRFHATTLWEQADVLLMRQAHPVAHRTVTREDLRTYPLLTVSTGGQEEGAVSGFITERGLARQSEMFSRQSLEEAFPDMDAGPRLRISVAHSLAIPALLRNSDMLALVPGPLARAFVSQGGWVCRATPYAASVAAVRAIWHARNAHDPALQWLRGGLAGIAASLGVGGLDVVGDAAGGQEE